jgi:uncharacterized damage-inducible protein DinB
MDNFPETTLVEFMRYNNWANQQVFDACQNLTEEHLGASMPGAYGTVRHTLTHIIRAEAWYLSILTGNRPQPPFSWEENPDVGTMRDYATRVGDALLDASHHIPPTDLICEEDQGNEYRYQAVVVFIQIINHGIEHRTNITTILNANQLTPPDVDGWGYLTAHLERFGYEERLSELQPDPNE